MRILRLISVLLPCLLMVACGGGKNAPTSFAVTGQVVDGYVEGATVYIVPVGDTTSANALYQSSTQTASDGSFRIPDVPLSIAGSPAYQLLAVGGHDTALPPADWVIPSGTVFEAPLDANFVTPLTTLVMETARKIVGSSSVTQASIDQAIANIAAVTGMAPEQAKEAILYADPMVRGLSNENSMKALALQTTITQLAKADAMGGDFLATVRALADELKNSSSLPADVVELATAAAPDSVRQAKAEVIASGIDQAIRQSYTAALGSASSADVFSSTTGLLQRRINAYLKGDVAYEEAATAINGLAVYATSGTIDTLIPGSTVAADLSSSLVKNYILSSASDGGIAQLLGINVKDPAIPVNIISGTSTAARMLRSATPGRATRVAASTNPCSGGTGTRTEPVTCDDLFGSCTGATGTFTATATCSNATPTSIQVSLQNFNSSLFGTTLNGQIVISPDTMSFTNISDGSTTFNGSVLYGQTLDSSGNLYSIDFAVKDTLAVTSPMWRTLTLDQLSRGKLMPVTTDGENRFSVFLSGDGTLKSDNSSISIAMNYDRTQDAVKSNPSPNVYTDNVNVKLDGVIRKGTDIVKLENFGLSQTRYFGSQTADSYDYFVATFNAPSKISTNKGYAYFRGSDITFNSNNAYVSGTISLATAP